MRRIFCSFIVVGLALGCNRSRSTNLLPSDMDDASSATVTSGVWRKHVDAGLTPDEPAPNGRTSAPSGTAAAPPVRSRGGNESSVRSAQP